jgi:hypothetical protein
LLLPDLVKLGSQCVTFFQQSIKLAAPFIGLFVAVRDHHGLARS